MRAKVARTYHGAAVIRAANLRRFYDLVTNADPEGECSVEVGYTSGMTVEPGSEAELIGLSNAGNKTISWVELANDFVAGLSVEVDLGSRFSTRISYRIEGDEDSVTLMRTALEEELERCFPWYSWVPSAPKNPSGFFAGLVCFAIGLLVTVSRLKSLGPGLLISGVTFIFWDLLERYFFARLIFAIGDGEGRLAAYERRRQV